MAYLGNAPARSFISFERQVFTIVNSQTAYTLDHSVNNENDIRLVVNNVVQEPGSGKAYTASGTTLTLSAALTNGTDEMYCVYLGRATATEAPGAGSVGTSQLASDAITAAKLNDDIISGQTELAVAPASTDELLISDGGTLKRIDVSLIGGTNTPAFFAKMASSQNITDNSYTKATFATEVFDTASAFTDSRFTVPSGQAGKYFIYGSLRGQVDSDDELINMYINIYKNGSNYVENRINFSSNRIRFCTSLIHSVLDLSVGDYVEIYGAVDTSSSQSSFGSSDGASNFGGYKIIE